MKVNNPFSVAQAERILREIDGGATDTALTLPIRSRHHAAGGEAAIAQAVLTWASTQRSALLSTYVGEAVEKQASEFVQRVVGLIAALVSDGVRDASGADITGTVRGLAVDRLRGLQGRRPERWSRGMQLEILCADAMGWPTPDLLYATSEPGRPLLSRIGFDAFASLLLGETVPDLPRNAEFDALRAGLADILYELFRNTDSYARSDQHGNDAPRSIRGILARRQSVPSDALSRIVSDSPALAAYVSRQAPKPGRRDFQLLEVSVLDAGPGYAAHWLRRPLSEIAREEELEAIETCFRMHATSQDNSTSGMGLCTVVDTLRRRNGFMRLRTGRQSLYADLGLETGAPYGTPPLLRPWQNIAFAPVVGTLFTFMLPV